MQKGLEPSETTRCMRCRERTSRYYGAWGVEGLCRECVLAMDPGLRRRVLVQLHPADRKRWQLDDLVANPEGAQHRERLHRRVQQRRTGAPEDRPLTPAKQGISRSHTESCRGPSPHTPQPEKSGHRRHTRVFGQLPVRFSITVAPPRTPTPLLGRSFRSLTKDISLGGVRIRVSDNALFGIPAGSALRMEISLRDKGRVVRCTGLIRNVVRTSRGRDPGYLCIQFDQIGNGGIEEIEQFVTARQAEEDR